MKKGKVYNSKLNKSRDKDTDVEVIRLNHKEGNTVRPYFTQPLFSNDGAYLLTASDRTGSWQLYNLEIKTGKMTQLTEESDLSPLTACLDGQKMKAYYWQDRSLKSVDLSNLKIEEIYQVPQGFQPSILSLSSDGKYLDFSYSEKLNLSTVSGRIYSGMEETFYQHPTSVVMRVDTEEKSARAIWGERNWISHVITSPVDSDIIVFCHEGPWHLVQRLWVVNAVTHQVHPLLEQQKHFERAGHEIFTAKGRVVAQYGKRSQLEEDWNNADLFIKPDGSCKEKFSYPGPKPMHVQVSSDEKYGVGDGAYLNQDFKAGDKYMSLIKYEAGQAKMKLLCRHDNSWESQISHPHPVFTPDDQNVVFNSDREGNVNIYLAPADW
ncbi:oligogalacturonide lyase [Halanaerobium saccharolyticum]|uniref:Oligogalacturonide lyase n=1 Tax=Halanaerobium saccharolyticum TaxID=43595 RepID=A0A4R6M2E8_9FIRM|nr:oligogalacturonate lyase family protein [Halanaerobium saccharolyticum]TDO95146.1 oligogalacturonide lyase [Halanaerobium saccharolyticum]